MAVLNGAGEADLERIKYGAILILAGLVNITIVFLVAVIRYPQASDVASAVGALTAVVGTLVGAFFGAHIGSAGRERAQATAVKLAAFMRPEDAKAALDLQPKLANSPEGQEQPVH
jgi:hypothetical protein